MTTTSVTAPVRTVDGTDVPATGTYGLDAAHSEVGFSVRHVMVSKTKGRFAGVEGTIVIADDPLESSVDVTIDAGSIDTREQGRDDHLRSADFLDVEQFPTLTYVSRSVTSAGKGRWTVEGDLTVKGVTRAVPLEVTFEGGAQDPWGGARIGFTARADLNREDFGLTWNQALETGGVLVGKTVRIEIEAEAVLQG